MRKPKTPPPFSDTIVDGEFFESLDRPDVIAFVRRANDGYLHWDKAKYQPLPEGFTPEQAWSAVKMSRISQLQDLPLSLYLMDSHMRYWTPPKHQEWLHQIDQKAGGTIGTVSGNTVPDDNDRYLFNSLMEEAIASSRLEGASTTREKAKKMLRAQRKPRNRAEQMILNNYRAILEIRDLKNDKLTLGMIKHIQEVITTDTLDDPARAGTFRTNDDVVQVVDGVTDEVMHDPPTADTIEERIDQLCAFANAKSKSFIHPVIKAIVLHFALGFIHPFVDGNGRTARAIFYWYMLKKGYWLFEYLPLSRILIKAPSQYERAFLYTEADRGDITYFTHFNLKTILQAIKSLHEYIESQVRSVSEATKILDSYPGLNFRQSNLVQETLKHPNNRYTISHHRGKYRVSYATARSDLFDLESRGLLVKHQEGKKLVFTPPENILARIKNTPKAHLKRRKSGAERIEEQGPDSIEQQAELF